MRHLHGAAALAGLVCVLVWAPAACGPDDDGAGERTRHFSLPGQVNLTKVSFSPNPAGLGMHKYVPQSMPAGPAPLVLVLHGCMQSPAQHAKESGWPALADKLKFYLVFPEQTYANNPATCFNWAGVYGDPANLIRGKGENASIVSMVNTMKKQHPGKIDAGRVFIVGFSAGAYMATVMLATWPDVFAGGAIMEGGPYYCADNVQPALSCMKDGQIHIKGLTTTNATPKQFGDLVRNKSGNSSYWKSPPKVPRVIVWHGAVDSIVYPPNQPSLVKQWTNLHGISTTPSSTGKVAGHAVEEFAKNGQVVVKSIKVSGMGHAVAIDPGTQAQQGGSIGTYSKDVNLYAPYHSAIFFGIGGTSGGGTTPSDGGISVDSGGGSSNAPDVDITSPEHASTVSGLVEVTADASESVIEVQFFVDGVMVHTDPSPPYEYSWDTSGLAAKGSYGFNGTPENLHSLSAVAKDAAGKISVDDDTLVRVVAAGGPQQDAGGPQPDAGGLQPDAGVQQDAGGQNPTDTSSPTVAITSPGTMSNVGTAVGKNPVKVAGSASDDTGVTKVELTLHKYTYAACLGSSSVVQTTIASGTSSWSHDLDVSSLQSYRCYRVEVRAHDAAGKTSAPAKVHLYVMNKLGS